MHFTARSRKILSLAALTFSITQCVGQVEVDCFSEGGDFLAPSGCLPLIQQFCDSINGTSIPEHGVTTFTGCSEQTPVLQCNLVVMNVDFTGPAAVPSFTTCSNVLSTTVSECPLGGEGSLVGDKFQYYIYEVLYTGPADGSCDVTF
ncbi:hypothetical protein B0H11DRAFT_2098241 [Mycena galericulata]|nr:hypothetical protein B0H11DRAFT_2098241 [Mycena galericulata]